jgi:hypothetical protein
MAMRGAVQVEDDAARTALGSVFESRRKGLSGSYAGQRSTTPMERLLPACGQRLGNPKVGRGGHGVEGGGGEGVDPSRWYQTTTVRLI